EYMTDLEKDLNTTIAAAVNARVEAAVMAALSGDELIGRYVSAALTEPVAQDTYGRKPTKTYLTTVVTEAIQEATTAAVKELVEAERPKIVEEVKKALRRNLPEVADRLVDGLSLARYSVSVNVAEAAE